MRSEGSANFFTTEKAPPPFGSTCIGVQIATRVATLTTAPMPVNTVGQYATVKGTAGDAAASEALGGGCGRGKSGKCAQR